jgi:hypothetical protein
MHFYTYKVVHQETGEYYYGSRVTTLIPEEDKDYLGSPVVWNPDKSKLSKQILGEWEDQKEALIEEAKLVRKHIKDPLNRNYHIPNIKFNLYKRTSKKWLIETYGEEKGLERYNDICKRRVESRRKKDNYKHTEETKKKLKESGTLFEKGSKPWNIGQKLSEDHVENIKKTWHSDKRMKLMQSESYKNKMSKSLSGDKNPMAGRSLMDVWTEKYGEEEAERRYKAWREKKKGQKAWNKGLKKNKTNE